ncbi:MAG TPA: hypothetical protein VHH34_15520 [Pseudonocardiaceae bacterium]|nr:hypothetical protein [Pseudonocardiaceae bacterium]
MITGKPLAEPATVLRKGNAHTVALVVSVVIVAGVSGCGQPVGSSGDAATPELATTSNGAPASLPDLVGRGLQNAQDTAQAAGFYVLRSHDSQGRGRQQIVDRDWKVCFQDPAPGQLPATTTVNLGAVKLDESCPATDQAGPVSSPAGAVMPDLLGKSVTVANQSLGNDASITFNDATGADRKVLVPSNWRICAQNPEPGEPYNGVPITLTVVKFSESC